MPSSDTILSRMYEVPEDKNPIIKIPSSKVDHILSPPTQKSRNIIHPLWNPIHILHEKSLPSFPSVGLILSNIVAYRRVRVKP